MKKVRITVMRKAHYDDLIKEYENPIEHACDMELGKAFISNGHKKPDGFCESAWETVSPFVMALSCGAKNFYDGWMKNERSAMISCNDGFRPVSFLLETMEEDADT
ncbi:MAG: TIGR04076 family protein [Clostridia bacterium]|nr:TIGR04076 family protein [Clostridia bacterium]